MRKKLIIHDFVQPEEIDVKDANTEIVFAASPQVKHCMGCFSCWHKTPGKCVIGDRCQAVPSMLAVCDELVIVSRMLYGGYSPEIKAVMDRSIGYIMPFFRIVSDEMHHTMRYDNPFVMHVHFYGETQSEAGQALAKKLVPANALNLGAGSCDVSFHQSIQDVKEALA